MLSNYLPLIVFLIVCLAFGVVVPIVASFVGPKRHLAAKDVPYESGIVPAEQAHRRFAIGFYVTAMLFIVFDVESVFLFPWATIVRELKVFGIIEMGVFIATLFLGLVYVWRKGALKWDE